MSDEESRLLYAELKELGVKIDNLAELFHHAAYGNGFTRCATHEGRLGHIEENVSLCHARIGGVKKWLVAGLVSVASLLANVVWNMIQATLRHQ